MGFLCFTKVHNSGYKRLDIYLFSLIVIYFLFFLFGALMIKYLEEDHNKQVTIEMRKSYQSFVFNNSFNFNETDLKNFLSSVFGSLKNGGEIKSLWSNSEENNIWCLDQSVLFTVSVLTMIGYGNMTPITNEGKLFVVGFAICGIPLTLFVLSVIVERLTMVMSKIPTTLNEKLFEGHKAPAAWAIYISIFITFVLVFLFILPSVLFSKLEADWSYLDSIYFCFISLTTIGFGDYVPAKNYSSISRCFYIAGLTIYLLFGIVLIVFFVQELCKLSCLQRIASRFSYNDDESTIDHEYTSKEAH